MDRNQTVGFLLLSVLLIGYMFFVPQETPQTPDNQPQTEQVETSTEIATSATANQQLNDSLLTVKYGEFGSAMKGESKDVVLENNDIKVTFDTFGGTVKTVLLKNYVTYTKEPLYLIDENSSKIIEEIATANKKIDLNSLYYHAETKGNSVVFSVMQEGNSLIQRTYTLADEGFVVNYKVDINKASLKLAKIDFFWKNDMKRMEKGLKDTRQKSTVNYYTVNQEFDDLTPTSTSKEEEKLENDIKWVSSKQKFFNSALITDKKFEDVKVSSSVDESNDDIVKSTKIALSIPTEGLADGSANLRYYFGPNEYKTCEAITEGFEENVDLGWSLFAPMSKYVFMPLFNFLHGFIPNYGIIILVMVLIIKTLLFPLTYKSYLSMGKMKALKPDLDLLKEKYGDDTAKIQSETMKIYQKAGANPISGCIPMLAQMPVFIALYNFFPTAIELRQQPFLWAEDLSSYDSIMELPFALPIYGEHVSLFALLWAISMFGSAYFNNQMSSSSMQNEQMKMFSYISPAIFMVMFNSFPSGLTFYYFISNLVTIIQQVVSRKFIDEEKLRKIIEENKKKNANKKKSGFQQRLEDAMKAQEDANKQRKKK